MGRALAKPIIGLREFDGFRFALPILRGILAQLHFLLVLTTDRACTAECSKKRLSNSSYCNAGHLPWVNLLRRKVVVHLDEWISSITI